MHRPTRLASAFLAVSIGVLSFYATASAQQPREVVLHVVVGQVTEISATDVASYSSGGIPSFVIRSSADGSLLLVEALQAGRTAFLVIMRDGTQVRYVLEISAGEPPNR